MRVAVVAGPGADGPGLAGYAAQILRAWGLTAAVAAEVPDPVAVPVVVAAASPGDGDRARRLRDCARAGGTVIACGPDEALAAACGLSVTGASSTALWLVPSDLPAAGLAGEMLPVPGRAQQVDAPAGGRVLGWLVEPARFGSDTPAVVEVPVGAGRLVYFAFDLPLAVLLLRQGDPERAERPQDAYARPSHLALERDGLPGWIPFADLLGRLLVDLVRRHLPAPWPLLCPLPDGGAGLVVFSGDEDCAAVAANDEELDAVAAAGGRMNLYIIPEQTHSTLGDARRYLRHHDLGPHPNLRHLDGAPVAVRLAELERQILLFESRFGVKARTLRNHCTAWAGYLEPIEVMARLGIRMEGNYFSGGYLRWRDPAPYTPCGGALPLPYCWPDGRLIDLYQQPTPLADDIQFGPDGYSYHVSPAVWSAMFARILDDIMRRFHVPYATCVHPSNWVRFSGEQGREILRQAATRGVPVWSFDQWATFWDARAARDVVDLLWDGRTLRFTVAGTDAPGLRVFLPARRGGLELRSLRVGGRPAPRALVERHGEGAVLADASAAGTAIEADYE